MQCALATHPTRQMVPSVAALHCQQCYQTVRALLCVRLDTLAPPPQRAGLMAPGALSLAAAPKLVSWKHSRLASNVRMRGCIC
jgi:hypothetical protein